MLSYNDVLNQLQYYILDTKNIQKIIRQNNQIIKKPNQNIQKPNPIIQKPNPIIQKPKLFIPNEQDSLFWCFYIMINGIDTYEMLTNKNTLIAKQLKINLVSNIRKNKNIIKMYKFDTITNIESNLAYDNNINPKTLLSLCAIENINVIYVNKKTYFELLLNDSNTIYVIHELKSQNKYYNKYGFELATEEILNNIRTTLYKLDIIDKPIKSLTSYKINDLINICLKLSIETINKDTGKNKSKNDLYESIIKYF